MTAGDILAFLTCERTVIYDEVHSDGWLGDFLEWDWFYFVRRTKGVTDVNVGDTGDRYDRTDAGFCYFYTIETIKFIEFADFNLFTFIRFMFIYNYNIWLRGELYTIYW